MSIYYTQMSQLLIGNYLPYSLVNDADGNTIKEVSDEPLCFESEEKCLEFIDEFMAKNVLLNDTDVTMLKNCKNLISCDDGIRVNFIEHFFRLNELSIEYPENSDGFLSLINFILKDLDFTGDIPDNVVDILMRANETLMNLGKE